MSALREEIERLAASGGILTEWNDKGEVRLWDPNDPRHTPERVARMPFAPDFIARTALITHLDPNHPEASELRPGTAQRWKEGRNALLKQLREVTAPGAVNEVSMERTAYLVGLCLEACFEIERLEKEAPQ